MYQAAAEQLLVLFDAGRVEGCKLSLTMQSLILPNPERSFNNGLLSELNLYYSFAKLECQEGVDFVMKVNDLSLIHI